MAERMDPLPERDTICNRDPEYERRVRSLLAQLPRIDTREDAAACFDALVAGGLIQAEHLDTQPFRFFLCHELVALHDLNLLFLMSAHFNLYAGTLLRLGSEKHREALRRADAGQVGCFALTERRHGVTSGLWLDTLARYDPARQCFVLQTPSPEAQKAWITNAGHFAENAVVMARLLVGSEDHGMNAFLVPLRPHRGAPTHAGISVEDVGRKTCLWHTDTANLSFDGVLVPRDNLLDRHTRVDAQGRVESSLAGLADHEKLERVANQLLSGRLCVAGAALAMAENALAVTVRRSRARSHRTGRDGSLALLHHASYRHQLVALLAEAWVRRAFTSAVQRAYAASATKTEPELVQAICAAKATNSEFARQVLATCQEKLGSEGLLESTGIGLAHDASYAAMLVEGDSRILLHKLARDALRALKHEALSETLRHVGRMALPAVSLGRRAALGKLLERRQLFQALYLAKKLRGLHGAEAAAEWLESLEDEALGYARALSDWLVWRSFAEHVGHGDLGVDRLFALRCIQRDASGFARFAGLRASQLASVDQAIARLCDALVPELDRLLPAASRVGTVEPSPMLRAAQ